MCSLDSISHFRELPTWSKTISVPFWFVMNVKYTLSVVLF